MGHSPDTDKLSAAYSGVRSETVCLQGGCGLDGGLVIPGGSSEKSGFDTVGDMQTCATTITVIITNNNNDNSSR